MPPNGVRDQRCTGVYWVEFDEPFPAGNIDSAEIDAESLLLLKQLMVPIGKCEPEQGPLE